MKTEFNVVVYTGIRRKVMKDRKKPRNAVGVTSRLNDREYLLFFDLDDDTSEALASVLDVIRKNVEAFCRILIIQTAKGYHIMVIGRYTWQFQNKLWTITAPYLDKKWVNLQRKRHRDIKSGAILRICGKYDYNDISLLYEIPGNVCDDGLLKWLEKYKFMRSLCHA